MRVHAAGSLALPAAVVTVGAFDGVHRGHQGLIVALRHRARELDVPAVVYTFDPPPRAHLQGARILTPVPEKVARLDRLGIDHVVIAHFDQAYMSRSAADFIAELQALHPIEVWVGRDFRFGRGRGGGLKALARAFPVQVVPPVLCARGEVISSTRVRSLIAAGLWDEAQALLGWTDWPLSSSSLEERTCRTRRSDTGNWRHGSGMPAASGNQSRN